MTVSKFAVIIPHTYTVHALGVKIVRKALNERSMQIPWAIGHSREIEIRLTKRRYKHTGSTKALYN